MLSPEPLLAETAPAKLNLYLHVTGIRPDGYHELDSLVVFAAVGDRLSATPAAAHSLALAGPFGAALTAEPDNLVLRAAHALALATGRTEGAQFTLEKNLPVAAGIGGGSADAAACLRLLGKWWNAPPDLALAASLGADVPVCLASVSARMSGIGERLAAAPRLPACGVVLINPGVPLLTRAVFRARTGPFSAPAALPGDFPTLAALTQALAMTCNDLEAPAIGLCPSIGSVLAALRGRPDCRLARMSGSGPTCFGLFDDSDAAARAAATLARPGWWSWGGALRTH